MSVKRVTKRQREVLGRRRRALWKGARRRLGPAMPIAKERLSGRRPPKLVGRRRLRKFVGLRLTRTLLEMEDHLLYSASGARGGRARRAALLQKGDTTRARVQALEARFTRDGQTRGLNKRIAAELGVHPDYVRKIRKGLSSANRRSSKA